MSGATDKSRPRRRKASFLVRVWQEAGGGEDAAFVLRGYLRDLGSGEERYLRDPADLGAEILRQFQSHDEQQQDPGEGEARAELGAKD